MVSDENEGVKAHMPREVSFLKTPRGMWVIWLLGSMGVLAAVGMSGDLGLLVFIADRELLVLVAETAVAYGIYAWRSGVVMVAWRLTLEAIFPAVARTHAVLTRLSM